MTSIYKGNIRRLIVKELQLGEQGIELLKYETPIIKKDALFYEGIMRSVISFDYNTVLPTYEEAESYVVPQALGHPHDLYLATCIFALDDEIHYDSEISRKQLKKLKKEYKMKIKNDID